MAIVVDSVNLESPEHQDSLQTLQCAISVNRTSRWIVEYHEYQLTRTANVGSMVIQVDFVELDGPILHNILQTLERQIASLSFSHSIAKHHE